MSRSGMATSQSPRRMTPFEILSSTNARRRVPLTVELTDAPRISQVADVNEQCSSGVGTTCGSEGQRVGASVGASVGFPDVGDHVSCVEHSRSYLQ